MKKLFEIYNAQGFVAATAIEMPATNDEIRAQVNEYLMTYFDNCDWTHIKMLEGTLTFFEEPAL